MAKGIEKDFASTTDMAEKKVTFSEIGTDLYAFTAEGDPNSAVIVGGDGKCRNEIRPDAASTNRVLGPLEPVRRHGWVTPLARQLWRHVKHSGNERSLR